MRLNQLRFLVALKKYGTFSRVARELYISQPSVSVAIKELEEELGYPLLQRKKNGITFTEQGEVILERAVVIMNEVEKIQNAVFYEEDIGGFISVGGTPHFCNSILLDVLMSLEIKYPKLSLKIEEGDSVTILKRIEKEEIDLGMVQLCDLNMEKLYEKAEKKELQVKTLFQEEMCFVTGEHHPLYGKESVSVEELLQYPYVTYKNSINCYMQELLQKQDCQKKIIHINEMVSLRNFVFKTNSFIVISKGALHHSNAVFQERFVALPVSGINWYCTVGLIHNKNPLSPAEERFVRELQDRCDELGKKTAE